MYKSNKNYLTGVVEYATTKKNNPSNPNPPQLNNFRTVVVLNVPVFLNVSASIPPNGTIIVINKCGTDPIKPASPI